MKRFLNTRASLVDQAIDGFLASSAGIGLARLADGPGRRVVLRAERDRAKVAVVSGGGSGHEPAHAGFVGAGMLDAAVCGEIFASPPVDAVLAAILAVTGEAGCLLVIKNYTGDRLNFGLAAEQARLRGLRVETVIVADDRALPDAARPRGLAGTLFVHRIAGGMAAAGHGLALVAQAARETAADLASIGLALSGCDPYGAGDAVRIDRPGPDEIELSLGIHGEPGAETQAMQPADALVQLAAARLQQALAARGWDAEEPLALLLNDLGAVPPLEMDLLLDAFRRTSLARQVALLFGPAPMMTALDMNGFSLSVLRLTPERRALLEAPVAMPAWPAARALAPPRTLPAPPLPPIFAAPASADAVRQALVERAAALLVAMAPEIDALDARIGDGDTGTTFAQAARAVLATLDRLPLADDAALLATLGRLLAASAGGSSGVLLSILFSAAAAHAGGAGWARAMRHGLEQMKALGGADLGDRTMIDALQPALDALCEHGPEAAAAAARAGADSTRTMNRAGAGRASLVPAASLHDVPDPGAEAIARLFEGLAG